MRLPKPNRTCPYFGIILAAATCVSCSSNSANDPAKPSAAAAEGSAATAPESAATAEPVAAAKPPTGPATAAPIPTGPATVAQAAQTLDLGKFPQMPGAETAEQCNLANLSYKVPAKVADAFEFQRGKLLAQHWQELPGSAASDSSASGTFTRNGFVLSVMVYTSGGSGVATVSLNNRGNIDLAKLPLPPGATPLYVGPASAMFVTAASPAETTEVCRKLLQAQGWQPYGTAGDSLQLKQNAIRLNAMISAAPAQAGKTVIQYSSEMLSADLPAPPTRPACNIPTARRNCCSTPRPRRWS